MWRRFENIDPKCLLNLAGMTLSLQKLHQYNLEADKASVKKANFYWINVFLKNFLKCRFYNIYIYIHIYIYNIYVIYIIYMYIYIYIFNIYIYVYIYIYIYICFYVYLLGVCLPGITWSDGTLSKPWPGVILVMVSFQTLLSIYNIFFFFKNILSQALKICYEHKGC